MSLFSKIGHALAAPIKGAVHLVTDPSKAISNIGKSVAPVYHGVATGAGALGGLVLGGPAGAIAGAKVGDKLGNIGDDLLAGRSVPAHLGSNLVGAGTAAALGGIGSGLGGVVKAIPGVSAIGSALGHIPGVSSITGAIDAIGDSGLGEAARALNGGKAITLGNLAGGAAKNATGLLGEAGNFLTGNGGLNALGVAQGVNSILDQKKAQDYANKATGTIEQQYAERAPLRAQSLQGLLNPATPDLSAVRGAAAGTGQPFAAPSRPIPIRGVTPTASPPMVAPNRPTPLRPRLADVGNPYAAQG